MYSKKDNSFPSNHRGIQEVFKQLFGADSELSDDDGVTSETKVFDVFASPIHEEFITPRKLKQLARVPSIVSPLPQTPTQQQVVSPNTLNRLTKIPSVISPLTKTTAKTTSIVSTSAKRTILVSPLKKVSKRSKAIGKTRKITNGHNNKQDQKVNTHNTYTTTQEPSKKSRLLELLHSKPYGAESETQSQTQLVTQVLAKSAGQFGEPQHVHHIYSQQQQQHVHANAQTASHVQLQTVQCAIHNNVLYDSYVKQKEHKKIPSYTHLKRTNFKHQQNNARINEIRTKESAHAINEEERSTEQQLNIFERNRCFRSTSATGPIEEKHNFERNIQVDVKNTLHRSIAAAEPLQQQQQQVPSAYSTRVIHLNNKNVPEGVHLAIAVNKNKHYSKNALKKITRNLAQQMN